MFLIFGLNTSMPYQKDMFACWGNWLSSATRESHFIYFTGNHDMWVFDYLPKEIGVTVYREPVSRVINTKHFYIGHGDGLGPGDHGYKIHKKSICQPVLSVALRTVTSEFRGFRLPIIFRAKTVLLPAQRMKNSWEKKKNGWWFTARNCCKKKH